MRKRAAAREMPVKAASGKCIAHGGGDARCQEEGLSDGGAADDDMHHHCITQGGLAGSTITLTLTLALTLTHNP